MRFITTRRARFRAVCGRVNLPWGTPVELVEGYLEYDGKRLCAVGSENAKAYFARDDDGYGIERGKLIRSIRKTLERRDARYQERWDRVWADEVCRAYRRKDHTDFWLWNDAFYHAPIEKLLHIERLVKGGGVSGLDEAD